MKTKKRICIYPFIVIGVLFLFIGSCKKDNNNNNNNSDKIPVLTTNTVTNITQNTATSGGNITSDGGLTITARGVCWSIGQNPTIANNKTIDGTGIGSFTSNITSLSINTTYFIRAYATNSYGTGYGDAISFETQGEQYPVVITNAISNIAGTAATSGGSITSSGSITISIRGVCWNTSPNPTTTNSSTSDGLGVGIYTSLLTGLTKNTKYYVRAYAYTTAGIIYGNELNFTTLNQLGIGDSYLGGKIAYIFKPGDPGYVTGQTHGLIVAPYDQTQTADWCHVLSLITGANGTALGTGNQNTIDIHMACNSASSAATYCSDLILGGYSDWYLPSKDELYKLYINRSIIGGFSTNTYWTSSQSDDISAWVLSFLNGSYYTFLKSESSSVRAIRSF